MEGKKRIFLLSKVHNYIYVKNVSRRTQYKNNLTHIYFSLTIQKKHTFVDQTYLKFFPKIERKFGEEILLIRNCLHYLYPLAQLLRHYKMKSFNSITTVLDISVS